MNVYEQLPVFQDENFLLRGVELTDAEQLLKVYSDKKAVPLFNGDNCHGDDFHYTTLQRMKEAVSFWQFSYENGYFVRWAVVDKKSAEAVGTIELFHRDSDKDEFGNCGLLRLDLRSDYEKSGNIYEILALIIPSVYDLFYCDKIATKVNDFAAERKKAVSDLGFKLTGSVLIGNEGEKFYGYYTLKKN